MKENGGIITKKDLQKYTAVERKPIKRENNRSAKTQTRSYKSTPSNTSRSSERSNNAQKSSASKESKKSSDKEIATSNSSRRRG